MALGRQGERQADLIVGWAELPRSPGHAFYDRLQTVLREAGFDGFAEQQCAPYYASKLGRSPLPPGRYFRMHLIGALVHGGGRGKSAPDAIAIRRHEPRSAWQSGSYG